MSSFYPLVAWAHAERMTDYTEVADPLRVNCSPRGDAMCVVRVVIPVLLVFSLTLPLSAQTTDSNSAASKATPTVFQADEGDRWMLLGDKPLIFKADPSAPAPTL